MQPYQPPNKQAEILNDALKDAATEKKNPPKQPVKPKNVPADKDKLNFVFLVGLAKVKIHKVSVDEMLNFFEHNCIRFYRADIHQKP